MKKLGLPGVSGYSSVEDVLRRALARVAQTEAHRVSTKKAFGMICATEIRAPSDFPALSRSHMDGYALRASDGAGRRGLRVVGNLGPGSWSNRRLGRGKAVRVATGAPLPEGADTVVPVEAAEEEGGRVSFHGVPRRGSFVYPRGKDVKKGAVVLRSGDFVRAQDVGLLLSLGIEEVEVRRPPKVAVLATGSELTNGKAVGGRVRNSHSPLFLRLIEGVGAVAVDFGIAKDDPGELSEKIGRALRECDCLLTLGGTSVGRRDLVGETLAALHPQMGAHGIRMDRGRVTGVAVVDGKAVVMMPGPVQGAMNAFALFALPIIAAVSGGRQRGMRVKCSLGSPWRARERFSDFVKVAYVKLEDGNATAVPLSGDTESMALLTMADGYMVVPEDVTSIKAGTPVEVSLLPGFSFA